MKGSVSGSLARSDLSLQGPGPSRALKQLVEDFTHQNQDFFSVVPINWVRNVAVCHVITKLTNGMGCFFRVLTQQRLLGHLIDFLEQRQLLIGDANFFSGRLNYSPSHQNRRHVVSNTRTLVGLTGGGLDVRGDIVEYLALHKRGKPSSRHLLGPKLGHSNIGKCARNVAAPMATDRQASTLITRKGSLDSWKILVSARYRVGSSPASENSHVSISAAPATLCRSHYFPPNVAKNCCHASIRWRSVLPGLLDVGATS